MSKKYILIYSLISKLISKTQFTRILYLLAFAVTGVSTSISYADTPPKTHVFPEPSKLSFDHFTSGTGFFIDPKHIVTNYHVVKGCQDIRVRGAITPSYVRLKAIDSDFDLALLESSRPAQNVAYIRNSSGVQTGEPVTVMGYPLEHGLNGDYLIKEAEVLELDSTYDGVERIHFTDTVEKGNSGGPLIDAQGSVIGIIVGKMNFFFAEQDETVDKPIKVTSVALNTIQLQHFLDKNNVFYRTRNYASNTIKAVNTTKEAEKYIVNIHCIKPPVQKAAATPITPSLQPASQQHALTQ